MLRIKICGITNEADVQPAAAAGADAIGLNFFRESRRFLEPSAARRIVDALPPGITRVGVFVNHTAHDVLRIVDEVGLDAIQLHGDEPASFLATLPESMKIVRAFRCGAEGLAPLVAYLRECRALDRVPAAVLVDADAGSHFGGTGTCADWTTIANQRQMLGDVRLVLAGGLTPENVAEAIRIVRPDGVDVASGVEIRPGEKDAKLVERFVAAARQALAAC